jgi:undecaprenyl-diphosphatase
VSTWEAAILGFIQGATEFLPVSSSGHLVIGQRLLNIQVTGVHFEVAVHVATLLSVVIVYRHRLSKLVIGAARGNREAWRYLGMLLVASIPAAAFGLALSGLIERAFDIPAVTGVALLGTGAILWSSKIPLAKDLDAPLEMRDAVVIGFAQAFALIPGISRSGSTVVAALWLGIEAQEAAAFSFLLAIPAIIGAAALQFPHLLASGALDVETTTLVVGGVVSAVTGVLAIKTFVMLLERKGFHSFGAYCVLAGLAFLSFLYVAG